LKAYKADVTSRRNALRSMVKRSIELHHQYDAIDAMPSVNIQWIKIKGNSVGLKGIEMPEAYGKGKPSFMVTASPKNIWISPSDNPGEGRDFSVTQLLAFDISAALAAGGTMADLVATASKGSNDGDEGDGDGAEWDESEAYEGFSKIANFVHKRDNVALVNMILGDKKHPERKEWLENIGEIYHVFHRWYIKNRSEIEEITGGTDTSDSDKAVA